jgi:hypothetical protein
MVIWVRGAMCFGVNVVVISGVIVLCVRDGPYIVSVNTDRAAVSF